MNANLIPTHRLFVRAYAASRRWDRLVARAIRDFGDSNQTPISGIYADHFPAAVKDELRATARSVTRLLDAAWASRPPRVRRATILRLRNDVISRHGKGFYG